MTGPGQCTNADEVNMDVDKKPTPVTFATSCLPSSIAIDMSFA